MNKLKSKLKNVLARCVVNLLEGSGYQVSVLNGETRSNLEHLQEFGLASVKPDGVAGNGISVFYGGNRGNGSLLVMEFPDLKPSLAAGESALFNAFNAIVKLTNGGVVELNGNTNEGIIKIVELTAKLNAHIAEYDLHVHSRSGHASPTGVPEVPGTAFVKADYENTEVVH